MEKTVANFQANNFRHSWIYS